MLPESFLLLLSTIVRSVSDFYDVETSVSELSQRKKQPKVHVCLNKQGLNAKLDI